MNEKEKSLMATFQAMETAEIERRLQTGQLADLAQVIARVVLKNRENGEVPLKAPARNNVWAIVLLFVVSAALMAIAGYLLLSSELFFTLFFFVVLPGLAMVMGKALPRLGRVLGWIALSLPLWLGAWMWYQGAFKWQAGDFKPLGTILAYVFLFIVSAVSVAFGGALLRGARHEGSWDDLSKEIDAQRQQTIDRMRRLD